MSVPAGLPIGATAIADRVTSNELKPNADGSINAANVVGGLAVGIANPYPGADQINLWIDAGQAFFVSSDLLTAAAANQAFMLTNPVASGKIFEVYRFNAFNGNANSAVQVRVANPLVAAFATDISSLIGNMNQASATTSVAKASYAVTATPAPTAAASSLPFFAGNTAINGTTEFLQNSARILLNANESLIIYLGNTAAGKIGANFWWVER